MTITVATLYEKLKHCSELLNGIDQSDFALLVKRDFRQVEMLTNSINLLTNILEQTEDKINEL